MADHPLRPATDHCLGRPLPHQQANPTRAPPVAINLSRMPLSRHPAYAVLAEVSLGYPPQEGRFPRATHPCATHGPGEPEPRVRLACVKHAASVRSEPGSNSHVQSSAIPPPNKERQNRQLDRSTPCRPFRRHTDRPADKGPSQRLPQNAIPNTGSRPRAGVTTTRRRPRIPSYTNNVNQQPPAKWLAETSPTDAGGGL